jgi:hypothetical protein
MLLPHPSYTVVDFTQGAQGQGFGPVPRASRDQGMISQGLPSALPGQRLHQEGQGGTTCPGYFQTRALRESCGFSQSFFCCRAFLPWWAPNSSMNSRHLSKAACVSIIVMQTWAKPSRCQDLGWGRFLTLRICLV